MSSAIVDQQLLRQLQKAHAVEYADDEVDLADAVSGLVVLLEHSILRLDQPGSAS